MTTTPSGCHVGACGHVCDMLAACGLLVLSLFNKSVDSC